MGKLNLHVNEKFCFHWMKHVAKLPYAAVNIERHYIWNKLYSMAFLTIYIVFTTLLIIHCCKLRWRIWEFMLLWKKEFCWNWPFAILIDRNTNPIMIEWIELILKEHAFVHKVMRKSSALISNQILYLVETKFVWNKPIPTECQSFIFHCFSCWLSIQTTSRSPHGVGTMFYIIGLKCRKQFCVV